MKPLAFDMEKKIIRGDVIYAMTARRSGKSRLTKILVEREKLARENEALHKTSAFLADEARRTERAMERARYRR
jgi:hypothetical protein